MDRAAYKAGFDRIDWSKHVPYEPKPQSPVARSDFPCPRIIGDTMELAEHVDGKHYDSKSAFRAVTKAHGYVEVGNDPARLRKKPKPTFDPVKRREAVSKAVAQVMGG